MQKFEVHITGQNKSILKELDNLNLKNITIDLLTPDRKKIRTEYMSSFVINCDNYEACLRYVRYIKSKLTTPVIRVKIECPYYPEYVQQSLYIEAHFTPYEGTIDNPLFKSKYPISLNKGTNKLMATVREYDKLNYREFREKWANMELELCVYDTYVDEDADWFNLYKNTSELVLQNN